MPKVKGKNQPARLGPPATTPEDREKQLVSLAVDLAEKQIRDGTATSQVITHFLKLATTRERIEQEILEKQKELLVEKTNALKAAQRVDELYENALLAMKAYTGSNESREDD